MTTTDIQRHDSAALLARVERFIYDEVDLLDQGDFPSWLRLFSDDCTYWVPAGAYDLDPTCKVSIVYDDHRTLTERVWRFGGGLAYAQQPPSSAAHLVSNVTVVKLEPDGHRDGDVVHVRAKFIISEFRRGEQHLHAGRYTYKLIAGPDGAFTILLKKVELINRNGHLGNLSMLL